MIVRIFSEGQYRIDDDAHEQVHAQVHELDNECVTAVEAGDAERFHACYEQLLDLIRSKGEKLADDELTGSDVMLPPADISLDEARETFSGEGLLPG